MAEQPYSADWNAEAPQFGRAAKLGAQAPAGVQASVGMQAPFGMQALWRLATWGSLATFALFAAVISAYSTATSQRPTASITPGQKTSGQVLGQVTLSQATPSPLTSSQATSGQATSGQASSAQASSGQATSGQTTSGPANSAQGTTPARTSTADFGARPDETAQEMKRLAEAVRALAADHEQVLARIVTLERNLDGVTGSIKRDRITGLQPTPPPSPAQNPSAAAIPAARPDIPAVPMAAAPMAAAPMTATLMTAAPVPAGPVTEAAIAPVPPAPQPSGASDPAQTAAPDAGNRAAPSAPLVRVSKVEPAEAPAEPMVTGGLGVDVGGASNYEGLRTLWHSTLNSDPTLLEQFYPVVAIRENSKTHGVDLRLVVGPIPDAQAAAGLCATLSAAHHYCQSVAFEGQRLSLNDTAPSKLTPAARHRSGSGSQAKFEPETPHFKAVIGK
jgi:hypothetical protein